MFTTKHLPSHSSFVLLKLHSHFDCFTVLNVECVLKWLLWIRNNDLLFFTSFDVKTWSRSRGTHVFRATTVMERTKRWMRACREYWSGSYQNSLLHLLAAHFNGTNSAEMYNTSVGNSVATWCFVSNFNDPIFSSSLSLLLSRQVFSRNIIIFIAIGDLSPLPVKTSLCWVGDG